MRSSPAGEGVHGNESHETYLVDHLGPPTYRDAGRTPRRQIQAYVVLPPGFDPGKKWPLVEVLHGGPHGITGDQFHFRWNLQLFAAPGYVVAAVNFHGSTGRGQDYAASILGRWGGAGRSACSVTPSWSGLRSRSRAIGRERSTS